MVYVYPYAANWHIYTLRYYLFPRHPEEIFHRLYLKTIISPLYPLQSQPVRE